MFEDWRLTSAGSCPGKFAVRQHDVHLVSCFDLALLAAGFMPKQPHL